jgi:hypothetical protein
MEARRRGPLPAELPRQAEHRAVRRELHAVFRAFVETVQRGPAGRLDRTEAETGSELDDAIRKPFVHASELAATSDVVNEAVGVHQALQQRKPLGDAGFEIGARDELAVTHAQVAKSA